MDCRKTLIRLSEEFLFVPGKRPSEVLLHISDNLRGVDTLRLLDRSDLAGIEFL
jgi:hypothetical protein